MKIKNEQRVIIARGDGNIVPEKQALRIQNVFIFGVGSTTSFVCLFLQKGPTFHNFIYQTVGGS